MTRARVYGSVVVAGLLAALGALGACVLADPPAALPTTPIEPPIILRASTQPRASDFLEEIPFEILVPVAADPRETQIVSAFLIDGVEKSSHPQDIEPDGGVFVQVDDPSVLFSDISTAECHTIGVSVSYADQAGSDTVTWFYSPTSSFTNCSIYDAGPEGGDAATDGDASGGDG
jgi:hypothetical protein